MKTDEGKLVTLRTLLKCRAKAVLEVTGRGPTKFEWVAAKETLLAEFDGTADRQEAMRQFKKMLFCVDDDPLVYAVLLRRSLLRALPTLDKEEQLLVDQFIDGMPSSVATYSKLLRINRPVGLNELADAARQLLNDNTSMTAIQTDPSISDLKTAVDALTVEMSAI